MTRSLFKKEQIFPVPIVFDLSHLDSPNLPSITSNFLLVFVLSHTFKSAHVVDVYKYDSSTTPADDGK